MNVFNRVVMVISLLVAVFLCTFSLLMPVRALGVVSRQLDGIGAFFSRIRPIVRVPAGILMALILDLILVLLIILEVRRPKRRSISVRQAAGGEVTLRVGSIADQLEAEIGQLPQVLRAKPRVSAKGGGVVVKLDVKMEAETGVPGKAERIVGAVRRVVEERMGLKLARPPEVELQTVRCPEAAREREKRPAAPMSEEEGTDEEIGIEHS